MNLVPNWLDMRKTELASWFLTTFVPDPTQGYDLMNPAGADNRYIHKSKPLTLEHVVDALNGGTRRLSIDGKYRSVPLSIAAIRQHQDTWATGAAINIDYGGSTAVERVLVICREYSLWAFAQLSTSAAHDGGHVYILTDQPQPASFLQNLAARILLDANVNGDVYPACETRAHRSLRLPLMPHLQAPNGPHRYPLLLQCGECIDASNPWTALAHLQDFWQPNSVEVLTQAATLLPVLPIVNRQPLHKSKVNPCISTMEIC